MALQTREKFCQDIIDLARDIKTIPQKTWAAYPEVERAKAEDNLTYARNFMKAIFEDG